MVILAFLAMRYNEKKGHWPLRNAKAVSNNDETIDSSSEEGISIGCPEKVVDSIGISAKVRSVEPVSPA